MRERVPRRVNPRDRPPASLAQRHHGPASLGKGHAIDEDAEGHGSAPGRRRDPLGGVGERSPELPGAGAAEPDAKTAAIVEPVEIDRAPGGAPRGPRPCPGEAELLGARQHDPQLLLPRHQRGREQHRGHSGGVVQGARRALADGAERHGRGPQGTQRQKPRPEPGRGEGGQLERRDDHRGEHDDRHERDPGRSHADGNGLRLRVEVRDEPDRGRTALGHEVHRVPPSPRQIEHAAHGPARRHPDHERSAEERAERDGGIAPPPEVSRHGEHGDEENADGRRREAPGSGRVGERLLAHDEPELAEDTRAVRACLGFGGAAGRPGGRRQRLEMPARRIRAGRVRRQSSGAHRARAPPPARAPPVSAGGAAVAPARRGVPRRPWPP